MSRTEKTGKHGMIHSVPHTHYDAMWVFTKGLIST